MLSESSSQCRQAVEFENPEGQHLIDYGEEKQKISRIPPYDHAVP